MKFFLFILFQFVCICVFAQEGQLEISHDGYWGDALHFSMEESKSTTTAMIGYKNCYVRKEPSLMAAIVDSLQLGKEVMVSAITKKNEYGGFDEETNNSITIRGIHTNWVQVQFENKKGDLVTAYLWKGFLAIGMIKQENIT
jgi:ABC-type cobalt transport system substrate-binding protein